jgi:hypothetical protein
MKKELEMIEQRIERLEPGTVVQLDALIKGVKHKGQQEEIKEAAAMLLEKYGIEYKE